MNSQIYIGLLDRNSFFIQGLMFFLKEYFNERNRRVSFVCEKRLSAADIIFYESNNTMAYFVGKALRSTTKDIILFSLSENKYSLSIWRLARYQQLLAKNGSLQQLRCYLDALWRERDAFGSGQRVSSPEVDLTYRQRQIMRLLAKGVTPAEISIRLNISIKTVSSHRGAVMKKFGFNRKIELYNWLILRGNEL
ncbi:response regulator transcription factor [Serratia marcescens]|uniref:response regulator transcription factor n=1 Tax=Serratia marcescens TaxID=615 RepID=UPI00148D04B2|nr:helix-turn-helix transcriptional regulator [Serratia marcescens]QJU41461.1 helix-turn-helix transcriptional regulator [Serratia marcescens]